MKAGPKEGRVQHVNYNEAIFTVDDTSDLPIWVQLRNRITYLIRVGYFKPGEQIPSVRSLSTSAKINYTTVTKAYKDLEMNRWIVSVRGRGMYVQKNITPQQEGAESAVDIVVEDCVKQYRSAGLTFEEIYARMKNIVVELEEETRSAAEEKMEYFDV
jgi:GntR family transcriptional regulator